jgi:hypothetical protein
MEFKEILTDDLEINLTISVKPYPMPEILLNAK